MRCFIATVFLALLLAVAGCSGGTADPGGDTGGPVPTETETVTEEPPATVTERPPAPATRQSTRPRT